MKVLLLSIFHPELVRGGAQQICYELFEGLKAEPDVEPVLLAAVDPSFAFLYKTGARITGFDGRPDEFLFLSRDYDVQWHRTPSRLLIESYVEFLLLVRPDVVHFHHFLLFGVDLLTVTRRTLPDARIVLTLHEFMAVCAADGQMVRRTDASLCERASSVRCHQCFPQRPAESFFLREQWMKRHLDAVDRFVTPTRFMVERFVDWGLDRERFACIPNGLRDRNLPRMPQPPRERRNRFGFFGQFLDNKGLHVLLQAVERLRAEGFEDFHVELNGDNISFASPERRAFVEDFLAREAALPADARPVTSNGSYEVDQLGRRMGRIDWCVMPSTWWEAFGLVISEAWMFDRPVICSDVGAMAERVRDGVDGLLFPLGDAGALADTIRRAATDRTLWERLVRGISPPPSREAMVQAHLSIYRGARPGEVASTRRSPALMAGV